MGREPRAKTCVLMSGGLDSAALLSECLARGGSVLPVFVRCGLRWEAAELFWLRRYLRRVAGPRILPLQTARWPARALYGEHWSLTGGVPSAASRDAAVYLPGRNVILLAVAAILGARNGIRRVAIGTLSGNPFGDASAAFFREYGRVLSRALGRSVTIAAPLARMRKASLIRRWPGLPLELTFSCLAPRGRTPCGGCNKCGERRRAFRDAGIGDPTRYARSAAGGRRGGPRITNSRKNPRTW